MIPALDRPRAVEGLFPLVQADETSLQHGPRHLRRRGLLPNRPNWIEWFC